MMRTEEMNDCTDLPASAVIANAPANAPSLQVEAESRVADCEEASGLAVEDTRTGAGEVEGGRHEAVVIGLELLEATGEGSARKSKLREAKEGRNGDEQWDGSALSPSASPLTPLGARRHGNRPLADRKEGDRGKERERERERERGRLNSRSSSGSSGGGGSGRNSFASGGLSPVFSLLTPDFRARTPSLEAFSIDISDNQSCDMELSIEVSSSITPRTREVPSRAHPLIPLTAEQEVAVLNVRITHTLCITHTLSL